MTFTDLSIEIIEEFFKYKNYSLASRHNGSQIIRHFLQHVYDEKESEKDCSVFVLKDNYRKDRNLPTTYEEQEIRDMIGSVERASAIGKRDYLVLLLATEYGWRAKDITRFRFSQIDWDKMLFALTSTRRTFRWSFHCFRPLAMRSLITLSTADPRQMHVRLLYRILVLTVVHPFHRQRYTLL